MAILKNSATQRKIHLRTLHVFGRGRSSDTLLDSPDASQLHASIRWTGTVWELRDHSRNGTLIDGTSMSHADTQVLRVGSTVCFGRSPGAAWVVEDLSPPGNLLWPLGHDGAPIPLQRSNLLPQGQGAEVSIHCTEQGQWICTNPHGSWTLEDGDEVRFSNRAWCFIAAAAEVSSTMESMATAIPFVRPRTALRFHVSLDEEHVRLEVQERDRTFDLGERTHHYALLTLARLRWADAQRHPDSQAHGWVELDRLAKMLGVEPGHLNIQVFRMRKQLALAMPADSHVPELVERRRGSLRFGSLRFCIMRGSQLEADFDPLSLSGQIHAEEKLAA
ncbi:hypothetical protein ASF11_24210 [Acidovorax sp. Leaf76]|uniref:FHA domain-containing protein n=1 Tax=unclassified Acidovorax TaxID=2684926 RepID=UPI0006FB4274|nr:MULTISPECIES: FHA domain-containing protein [unclassified Acidovorax]KQO21418.1 hypothetical protein ASF11_24210 [Acidovorax sp. Leaf76]KQO35475.1 hypothetical protein ASF19_23855 [Acidovorax sp. Leaf84]KQS37339.1 hypothetical protein ASG27_24530 [Acidovorax sp. Leaf191]